MTHRPGEGRDAESGSDGVSPEGAEGSDAPEEVDAPQEDAAPEAVEGPAAVQGPEGSDGPEDTRVFDGGTASSDAEDVTASDRGGIEDVPEASPQGESTGGGTGRRPADHEQLDEADRIPDPVWAEIVRGFSRESGSGTEMSRDEIADALQEDEGYVPPDPGPIGVHTGPPLVVLCWVLAVGGALSLLFMTVVVRAVPALLITVAVTSLVLGVLGLFWQLPKNRDSGGGDGAQV